MTITSRPPTSESVSDGDTVSLDEGFVQVIRVTL